MKLAGGYLTHHRPAIRSGHNAHTSALPQPLSELDIAALNAAQATPWRVNRWVLDVMQEAWAKGLRIGGLEVNEPLSLPERLPDDVWEALSAVERNKLVDARVAIHVQNASIMGQSQAILDALEVAEELRNKPAIYYPHAKDFRGRIYPEPTMGPHPQGSDIQKALIMFAEGMPLGDDGLYWLCIRAANAAGQDKLTLEERVGWTLAHQEEIERSATTPLEYTWWAEATDEPWSLLATCYELASAMSMSHPSSFVSHLPIPLDGSCNGLQHLAAMGLDPVGAKATNLTAEPTKQDIYSEIARKVELQVEQDALDGIPEATVWQGKVTRKTVKRAVMTTPYGVTDRGIRDQLIWDGFVPKDTAIGAGQAADYLRDRLVDALGGTVQSARSIMSWLQGTAERLAKAGLPFDWTTPAGSKVRQGYYINNRTELWSLVARVTIFKENQKAALNPRKQALGAAPNVIHSFDAAHLSMTVAAAAGEGITSFAMIHDSYGTHAGNTTRLGMILREQFIAIYKEDWLTRIKEEIEAHAPWVKIDDPPERGTFDIEQVREAPYFFS